MPSDFTYDNGAVPAIKTNRFSIPAGQNPNNYVQDQDVNLLTTAVASLRTAILGGQYYNLADSSSAPLGSTGNVRTRSLNGKLQVSQNGGPWRDVEKVANVLDYPNIDPTGATLSTGLQAAIDANKGKIIYLPDADYLYAAVSLDGSSYNGTTLIGPGRLILSPDGGLNNLGLGAWIGLLIRSCTGITINGITFNGNRTAMTHSEHIFSTALAGADNVLFANCNFKELRGDGIYIAASTWPSSGSSTNSSRVKIINCHGLNTVDDGRNMVSVISCAGIQAHGCSSVKIGTGVSDGSGAGGVEPGGIDFEPDVGTDLITDVVVDGFKIETAGTSGFQLLGKSISGVDASLDWNIQGGVVSNVEVLRTLHAAQAPISKVRNVTFNNVRLKRTDSYGGAGWLIDKCNEVRGRLSAEHVTVGAVFGASGDVQDSDLVIDATDFNLAAIEVGMLTRTKITTNCGASVNGGFGPFGLWMNNFGRVGVAHTGCSTTVNAPNDSVIVKAVRNEPSNLVTSFVNSEVNGNMTGYSSYSAIWDTNVKGLAWAANTVTGVGATVSNDGGKTYQAIAITGDFKTASSGGPTGTGSSITDNHVTWKYIGTVGVDWVPGPTKRNIQGLDSSVMPATGFWIVNEFVRMSGSPGSNAVFGWLRLTTGTSNVLGTDWAVMSFPANNGNGKITLNGANGNVAMVSMLMGVSVTATASAHTALDTTSNGIQIFTGSVNQTIDLPDARTISIGQQWRVLNESTGSIFLRTADASVPWTVGPGCSANVLCTDNTSLAGVWDVRGSVLSGQATLISGSVTVTTGAVKSSSRIMLTHAGSSISNLGTLYTGTIVAGTSFQIKSSNASDADSVNWEILN